jgi:hypothetical protein
MIQIGDCIKVKVRVSVGKDDWRTWTALGIVDSIIEAHMTPGEQHARFFAGAPAYMRKASKRRRFCIVKDNGGFAVVPETPRAEIKVI